MFPLPSNHPGLSTNSSTKKKKKNSQEPKTLLEDLSQWREKEDMDSESLDLVLCFSVVTG